MSENNSTHKDIALVPTEKPKIAMEGKREVGTVKWFSARKCFGFLGNNDKNEGDRSDVFVHLSQLHCPPGSYRTLKQGMLVEYTKGHDDESGRDTANDVTAVGGGWIVLPPRPERERRVTQETKTDGVAVADSPEAALEAPPTKVGRQRNRNRRRQGKGAANNSAEAEDRDEKEEAEAAPVAAGPAEGGKKEGRRKHRAPRNRKQHAPDETKSEEVATTKEAAVPMKEPTPRKPQWHDSLDEDVRNHLKDKGIYMRGTTVDVLVTMADGDGAARIKIGSDGYTTCVHQKGILAEGSYDFKPSGEVTLKWERALEWKDNAWRVPSTPASELEVPQTLNLGPEGHLELEPVKIGDAVASSYGEAEGKVAAPDQKVLKDAGFAMRNVIHDPARTRVRRRRNPNHGRKSNGASPAAPASEGA